MDIEIKVTITAPDGTVHTEDIAKLTKAAETIGDVGLSIAESKVLLLNLQQEIVSSQSAAFCTKHARCQSWPKGPEAAYLGFRRNIQGTDCSSVFRRWSATFSAENLKPRPSATRSALIGYFGRLGLIAVMRKVSP